MNQPKYCCEAMAYWIAHPMGANASPKTTTVARLNEAPFDQNSRAAIFRSTMGEIGIIASKLGGHELIPINFCPWCGTDLQSSNPKPLTEVFMPWTDDVDYAFDERMSFEEQLEAWGPEALCQEHGLPEGTPPIEVFIRLNKKQAGGIDFDTWNPRALAHVLDFCSLSGTSTLVGLLMTSKQPAVWALAMMDVDTATLPALHDVFFSESEHGPVIAIECVLGTGEQSRRDAVDAVLVEGRETTSKMKGYDITAGEEVKPFYVTTESERASLRKLANYVAEFDEPSNPKHRIFHYLVPDHHKDDVASFLAKKSNEG